MKIGEVELKFNKKADTKGLFITTKIIVHETTIKPYKPVIPTKKRVSALNAWRTPCLSADRGTRN